MRVETSPVNWIINPKLELGVGGSALLKFKPPNPANSICEASKRLNERAEVPLPLRPIVSESPMREIGFHTSLKKTGGDENKP
jgi:hypothetical protein